MSNNQIIKLTFGATFSHKFQLLDYWGEIADSILYKNKYFSTDIFPQISTNYTTERSLFHPEKGYYLEIKANNFIYSQPIENDYDTEYKLFCQRVADYIVPSILSKYGLVIHRLGMVFAKEMDERSINEFAGRYFKSDIQNIMDFRFSKKETTPKGMIQANINDFTNKIYTIGNIANDVRGITYDYQLYFNPFREDVRGEINKFIKNAEENFKTDL